MRLALGGADYVNTSIPWCSRARAVGPRPRRGHRTGPGLRDAHDHAGGQRHRLRAGGRVWKPRLDLLGRSADRRHHQSTGSPGSACNFPGLDWGWLRRNDGGQHERDVHTELRSGAGCAEDRHRDREPRHPATHDYGCKFWDSAAGVAGRNAADDRDSEPIANHCHAPRWRRELLGGLPADGWANRQYLQPLRRFDGSGRSAGARRTSRPSRTSGASRPCWR
jgi:hypothetical protein